MVQDTGSGIDPQILPRLFTKFTTGSEKGTGLGLYICKNMEVRYGEKTMMIGGLPFHLACLPD